MLRGAFPIEATDTTASLHDRLAGLGARLCVEVLGKLPLPADAQPAEGVTYAHKIEKAEAVIDWTKPAIELDRHIRAFNPFPGAAGTLDGAAIKVWRAELVAAEAPPGTVVSVERRGIVVACGDGGLCLTELQKAGGKRLPVAQFLAGNPIVPGKTFALPS